MEICELRQKLLDHDGHALVIGGPGSGKTTIALKRPFFESKRVYCQAKPFCS